MMRSSNPVLNDKAFENEHALLGVERMSINGAVNKTAATDPGALEAACPSLTSLKGVDFETRQDSFLRE